MDCERQPVTTPKLLLWSESLWAPYTTSHEGPRSASWRQLYSDTYLWSTELFLDKYFLRMQFCQWLQHQHAADKVFCGQRNLLLRKDVVSIHNSHLWARYAPHVIRKRGCRTRLNVFVCAPTVWDITVMSIVLPNRLTAQWDPNLVLIIVPRLLEEVLLVVSTTELEDTVGTVFGSGWKRHVQEGGWDMLWRRRTLYAFSVAGSKSDGFFFSYGGTWRSSLTKFPSGLPKTSWQNIR